MGEARERLRSMMGREMAGMGTEEELHRDVCPLIRGAFAELLQCAKTASGHWFKVQGKAERSRETKTYQESYWPQGGPRVSTVGLVTALRGGDTVMERDPAPPLPFLRPNLSR